MSEAREVQCPDCDGKGLVVGYVPIGMDPSDGYVHEQEVRGECETCQGKGVIVVEAEDGDA